MAVLTSRRVTRPALCAVMTAAALLYGGTLWAHHGRILVVVHPDGARESLAANLVAAYVGEQMGRTVKAQESGTIGDCLKAILDRKAPMGLVAEAEWSPQEGLTAVGPPLTAASETYRLVMGADIASELSFTLLPDYLARLGRGLAARDLTVEIEEVRRGRGARGLAEKILREMDLL